MAVTLDATLSGATSNSYIDMTTAVALAANIPGGGDWVALGEEERNLSLIVATRWLETLTYAGNRCAATQRLTSMVQPLKWTAALPATSERSLKVLH